MHHVVVVDNQDPLDEIDIPVTQFVVDPPGYLVVHQILHVFLITRFLISALEGFIEKKGGKTLGISGNWQSRYFIMKKPCILEYHKEKNTTQVDECFRLQ